MRDSGAPRRTPGFPRKRAGHDARGLVIYYGPKMPERMPVGKYGRGGPRLKTKSFMRQKCDPEMEHLRRFRLGRVRPLVERQIIAYLAKLPREEGATRDQIAGGVGTSHNWAYRLLLDMVRWNLIDCKSDGRIGYYFIRWDLADKPGWLNRMLYAVAPQALRPVESPKIWTPPPSHPRGLAGPKDIDRVVDDIARKLQPPA